MIVLKILVILVMKGVKSTEGGGGVLSDFGMGVCPRECQHGGGGEG